MSGKLFFKHLFTSIKRRPLQPVLLTLVILLATAVCITILNVQINIESELDYTNTLAYGNCDYVVSPNSLSSSEFLTINPARKLLDGKADLCGILGMPMFTGDNQDFIYGAVSDFSEIGKIFPLYLPDDISIKDEEVSSSCIISQDTADTFGLSIGDSLPLTLFGYETSYTVQGITKYPIQNTYGVLVDISSLMKLVLTESDFAFFAAFIDYDLPISSKLYVRATQNKEEVLSDLTTLYPDMTIQTGESLKTSMYSSDEFFILMVITCLIFVVLVIYCCCHIISLQRTEETYLFACVGARPRALSLVSMAEIALYWVIGSVGGAFLSSPLNDLMIRTCSLTHCQSGLHVRSILIAVSVLFFASEASLLIYTALSEYKKRKIRKKKITRHKNIFLNIFCIVTGVCSLGFFIPACIFEPSDLKWIFGIIAFILFVFFLFLFGKVACKTFPKLLLKNKSLKPPTVYALKNAMHVETLTNTTAIATVFFTVLFSILFLLNGTARSMDFGKNFLQGDYLVAQSGVSSEVLSEAEGVLKVNDLLMETITFYDGTASLFATDELSAFTDRLGISDLPKNNEAYIAGVIVNHYHLKIGDTFTIHIGQETFTFTYAKSIPVNTYMILINAEDCHIPYSYQIVTGEDEFDQETLYENIITTLSLSTATVLKTEDIQKHNLFNYYYIDCGVFILTFITVFSLIGMVDNILSSYRSRREEFYSYSIAGMSKNNLLKMKRTEIIYAYVAGFITFLLFLAVIVMMIYESALGFYMNVFWMYK